MNIRNPSKQDIMFQTSLELQRIVVEVAEEIFGK